MGSIIKKKFGQIEYFCGERRRYTLKSGEVIMYYPLNFLGKCANPEHWGINQIRSGEHGFYNVTTKKVFCCAHSPIEIKAMEQDMTVEEYGKAYHIGEK